MKKLSVIIPRYSESESFIRKGILNSIQSQAGFPVECVEAVVVDDAGPSSLDEAALFQGYDFKGRVITLKVNGGPGVARQAGFDAASGEWITTLDADDLFCPWAFNLFDSGRDKHDWLMLQGTSCGVDPNSRIVIVPHSSGLTWMFGHFFRTSWLRSTGCKYHPEIRSNEEQILLQALFARVNKERLGAAAQGSLPVYVWNQASVDTITRRNDGEYSVTCVPEWTKGRYIVLKDLVSLGKHDEVGRLLIESAVHNFYALHSSQFDGKPEWKANAEAWMGYAIAEIGWPDTAAGVYREHFSQVFRQGSMTCDKQVTVLFDDWKNGLPTEKPERCMQPDETFLKI
jgi:glycosyltransferase involved in cell wall biosynthesis